MKLENMLNCIDEIITLQVEYNKLLKKFDNLFREINVYAKSYKMTYGIKMEENARSNENGYIPKEVKMYFTGNSYHDKNKYNEASCIEVAVIFVGENGEPPVDRNICVYILNLKSQQVFRLPSKYVDLMTYQLIFRNGGFGWMPNMKHNDSKNNISTLQYYSSKFSIRNNFSPFLYLDLFTQNTTINTRCLGISRRIKIIFLKKQLTVNLFK